MGPDVLIDPQRVEHLIGALARHGSQPSGGVTRLVYDPPWQQAQSWLAEIASGIGLAVRTDAVGNLWAAAPGRESGAVIATGSHLDTVASGGRFDGALGIVGGLLAIEALRDRFGAPRVTLELVAWCEEEGSRFHMNFLGSRAACGLLQAAQLHGVCDARGVPLDDAMRACDLDPAQVACAARSDLAAYLELHVEQGRVLHDQGLDVGIVQAITGIRQWSVELTGRADHAGTTPMSLRRDAGRAAAEMIQRACEIAEASGGVATCGAISLQPGGANVVPGIASFTIDMRHVDRDRLEAMTREQQVRFEAIATARRVELRMRRLVDAAPVAMDAAVQKTLSDCAGSRGLRWTAMPSGAGHDAQIVATRTRAGMLFVPSRDGRSHCADEFTSPQQAARGIDVLADALYALAY
jgi:allantoate deiminase